MTKVLLWGAAIAIFLIAILVGPWLTWMSFQAVTNGDGTFTWGDFFAALWISILFAGAGAWNKSNN